MRRQVRVRETGSRRRRQPTRRMRADPLRGPGTGREPRGDRRRGSVALAAPARKSREAHDGQRPPRPGARQRPHTLSSRLADGAGSPPGSGRRTGRPRPTRSLPPPRRRPRRTELPRHSHGKEERRRRDHLRRLRRAPPATPSGSLPSPSLEALVTARDMGPTDPHSATGVGSAAALDLPAASRRREGVQRTAARYPDRMSVSSYGCR